LQQGSPVKSGVRNVVARGMLGTLPKGGLSGKASLARTVNEVSAVKGESLPSADSE
jgi:hypothetical protein